MPTVDVKQSAKVLGLLVLILRHVIMVIKPLLLEMG